MNEWLNALIQYRLVIHDFSPPELPAEAPRSLETTWIRGAIFSSSALSASVGVNPSLDSTLSEN
jgi:hypothetical protein